VQQLFEMPAGIHVQSTLSLLKVWPQGFCNPTYWNTSQWGEAHTSSCQLSAAEREFPPKYWVRSNTPASTLNCKTLTKP